MSPVSHQGPGLCLIEEIKLQFINPEDIPPSVMEHLRQQIDLQNMGHEARIHEVRSFLHELTEEQLVIFRNLMSHASGSEEIAGYYQGICTTLLDVKFQRCACGSKHDPNELLKKAATRPADEVLTEEQAEYRDAKMKEYRLEEAPVPGNPKLTHLRCIDCQTPVVSLEDRMLREPGVKGCEGCQHKTKWG